MKEFHDACDRAFRFLVEDFGCWIKERVDTHNVDWIDFENQTTAVRVSRDPHQPAIIITFYVLAPVPPLSSGAGQLPKRFDLLILLRMHGEKPLIGDPWAKDFDVALAPFAKAVRQYGAKVLAGDFSELPQIQAERARRGRS